MNNNTLLSLENIHYNVMRAGEKKEIIENVSFNLSSNTITTLIGPNGAGKTTLIKIMLGVLKPSRGKVQLKKKLRIGYIPQTLEVNPYLPLTVKDFFELQKMPSKLLLKKLGVGHLLDYSFHDLSGGEKQRVLFAQALSFNPQLLVLDEPTQGIDIVGQKDFYELLNAFKEEKGFAVFLVSHDLHTVLGSSNHVICLNKHICCSGTPQFVKNDDQYKKIFGVDKTAKSNDLVPYEHHHDHCHDGICSHEDHKK